MSSERHSGEPFNRPTDAAVSSNDGSIFISDGYGNARVHRYSAEGELELSWGEPGIDVGQFMVPHNLAIDEDDRIYVADRESHRVQIFDRDGGPLAMWNNVPRPCGMTMGGDGLLYVGELNGVALMEGALGIGHRVSIYSREGELLARLGDPEEGEEAGTLHRAARDGGRLARRHLCRRGRPHDPRPPPRPASGAAQHQEAAAAGVAVSALHRCGGGRRTLPYW